MIHLRESERLYDEKTGNEKRMGCFPVGKTFRIEYAHTDNGIKTYRVYKENGEMDYFTENELNIIKKIDGNRRR